MTDLDRDQRLALSTRLLAELAANGAANAGAAEVERVDLAGRTDHPGPLAVAVLSGDGRVVESPLAGAPVRFVVFPAGVLEPTSRGLALRRVAPGVSAREVQAHFGVPLVADESLAPIGGDDDAS